MIQAPNNMADFMSQAKGFVEKARANGADDTAIANTIRFMYGLTQQNIENEKAKQMTPYEQAQVDLAKAGKWEYNSDTGQYYNTTTGETRSTTGADTDISGSDFGMGTAPQSNQSSPATAAPGFDISAFDQSWTSTSKQEEPKTVSTASSGSTWQPDKWGGISLTLPSLQQLQTKYPAAPEQTGPTNAQIAASNPNSWQAKYSTPSFSFKL